MRFYFLHGGLREPPDPVDPSSGPRPGYLYQTDAGEDSRVGTGLSGYSRQHIRAALEPDDVANSIRQLELGAEDVAPGQLGL